MKTEETLTIERLLSTYDPETIAGCSLNKFRGRYLAYECPVKTGTISAGLIDCVRVDEVLVNGKDTFVCNVGLHKGWYLQHHPAVLDYVEGKTCEFNRIEDLPECCDSTTCSCRTLRRQFDNEILITCYEIKVTKEDFHSKHGHNFVGNANFYVMPKELYAEVKDEIPEGIGVICHVVTDKMNGLRKVREAEYRPLFDGDSKWMLLNVLKKQRNWYDPPENHSEDYELFT